MAAWRWSGGLFFLRIIVVTAPRQDDDRALRLFLRLLVRSIRTLQLTGVEGKFEPYALALLALPLLAANGIDDVRIKHGFPFVLDGHSTVASLLTSSDRVAFHK